MIEDSQNKEAQGPNDDPAPAQEAPQDDAAQTPDVTLSGADPAFSGQPDVIIPPFKPGDEIILNGRYFVLHRTTENEVIFRQIFKPVPADAQAKAFRVGDQFEWKSWAFIVTQIVPPKRKRDNKKRQSVLKRPLEIHARPSAVRRSELSKAANPTPADYEKAEEYIGPILEKLAPPTGDPILAAAWAEGIEAFFGGKPESDNPYGSLLVGIGETDRASNVRLLRRQYWIKGWGDAYQAAREMLPPDEPDAEVEQRGQLIPDDDTAVGGRAGGGKTARIIEMGMDAPEQRPAPTLEQEAGFGRMINDSIRNAPGMELMTGLSETVEQVIKERQRKGESDGDNSGLDAGTSEGTGS